jgi:two-component sensor histidine kinase
MTASTQARARILVADDESIIAMQIGELLEAEGYALAGVAGTAAQAVDLARELAPDLVLMDIVMPAGTCPPDEAPPVDGIDACERIQREFGIPVVLLSAHGEEHYLARARRALPSAFLLKPCQNTQIRAAIEVALALRPTRDPAAPFRLREAHHRLKNSFSLLHSILRFQEITAADPQARHALADAGARVLAMAKSHEAMTADGLAPVDAARHLEGLALELFEAQSPPPAMARLSLTLDMAPLRLAPAQVPPCAIFLAEALTNAVRHAYPSGGGEIRIRLTTDATSAGLCVEDDGVGFAGDPGALGGASFGVQCLRAAAEQLDGVARLETAPGGGARVGVRFPLLKAYQRRSA